MVTKQAEVVTEESLKKDFEKWLLASYKYYWEDDPIMPDLEWDMLGRKLTKHWDKFDHPAKSLIEMDGLVPVLYTGHYISKNTYLVKE